MKRCRILDLYCKAGGAGKGYHDAGFEVVGVDIEPQPRYPFEFIRADAIEFAAAYGSQFDAIHASPPCQRYASITRTARTQDKHPDLIVPTREILLQSGKPYVIENVPGARRLLRNPLMLCGTMFGLLVIRHRYFELSFDLWWPPQCCQHERKTVNCGRPVDEDLNYITVAGHFSNVPFAQKAMRIDWMGQDELREAIPPAYTEFIGRHLLQQLDAD